jgi:hypothetical protein
VKQPAVHLITPQQAEDMAKVRDVFEEYAAGLGVALDFQDFESELDSLPEVARAAIADWRNTADQRLSAITALRELADTVGG